MKNIFFLPLLLLTISSTKAQWNDEILAPDFTPFVHSGREFGVASTFGNKLAYSSFVGWKDGQVKVLEDPAGNGDYIDVGFNVITSHLSADPANLYLFAEHVFLLENGLDDPSLFIVSKNDNDNVNKGWIFIYDKNPITNQYELSFSYGNPNLQSGTFGYKASVSENHEHVILIDYPSNIYTFSRTLGGDWKANLDIQSMPFTGTPTRVSISNDGFSAVACELNSKCKVFSRAAIGNPWTEFTELTKPTGYTQFGSSVSINNNHVFICSSGWVNAVNANGKLSVYDKNIGTNSYDFNNYELTSDDLQDVSSSICSENGIQTKDDKIVLKHSVGIAIFNFDGTTATPFKYVQVDGLAGGISTNGVSDILTIQTIGSTSSPSYHLYRSVMDNPSDPTESPTKSPTKSPTVSPTTDPPVGSSGTCNPNPCQNNGVCFNNGECACVFPYYGSVCENERTCTNTCI